MVRDVFRLAKENAPSIIFIDEVRRARARRGPIAVGAAPWRSLRPGAAASPAGRSRPVRRRRAPRRSPRPVRAPPTGHPQVDAIATARFDAQTGADREVQRILMELLNQMDGFDQTVNVKVGRQGVEGVVQQLCSRRAAEADCGMQRAASHAAARGSRHPDSS
jgi:SpoVK/Ycf46/Vps4 family AAA+-type ATPase